MHDPAAALRQRIGERSALLDRGARMLHEEPAIRAAWMFGSGGRGRMDGFSDLDIAVVVADDHLQRICGGPARPATYAAIVSSARGRFAARIGDPLLLVEAPQNAPRGGAFLSAFYSGGFGPQGIDWEWQPESSARRPDESVILFDRRKGRNRTAAPVGRSAVSTPNSLESAVQSAASAWAMTIWAGKGVARHPDRDFVPLMPHLTDCVRTLESFLHQPAAPAEATGLRAIRKMRDRLASLRPALAAAGVDIPPGVGDQVDQYLALVGHIVAADPHS
ncbi:MAG TPA: nucleotidyltransferase domain-containing protein [Mycobacteriales bacterium]|nr:nucleotidyltransferase domain-containing protein [Mycobacteriales bacterium]